jgi:hypothetical protein
MHQSRAALRGLHQARACVPPSFGDAWLAQPGIGMPASCLSLTMIPLEVCLIDLEYSIKVGSTLPTFPQPVDDVRQVSFLV